MPIDLNNIKSEFEDIKNLKHALQHAIYSSKQKQSIIAENYDIYQALLIICQETEFLNLK